MKSKQRGFIQGLILFIFVVIGIALFIMIKAEDQAYEIFNKFVSDELSEKVSNFFSKIIR